MPWKFDSDAGPRVGRLIGAEEGKLGRRAGGRSASAGSAGRAAVALRIFANGRFAAFGNGALIAVNGRRGAPRIGRVASRLLLGLASAWGRSAETTILFEREILPPIRGYVNWEGRITKEPFGAKGERSSRSERVERLDELWDRSVRGRAPWRLTWLSSRSSHPPPWALGRASLAKFFARSSRIGVRAMRTWPASAPNYSSLRDSAISSSPGAASPLIRVPSKALRRFCLSNLDSPSPFLLFSTEYAYRHLHR
ncbi:hypothetical protein KM043_006156 [Ampulex compressa]|nr:hypothetical protein KM043_006156 [Ampulex compressa]